MKKGNKYPKMQIYHEAECPCYNGDGYAYQFDGIEFLFCDTCNKKLLVQMVEQHNIEKELVDEIRNLKGSGKR